MSGNAHFPRKKHFSSILPFLIIAFLFQGFTWLFAKKETAEKTAESLAAQTGASITDASKEKFSPDSNAKQIPTDSVYVIGSRLPAFREDIKDIPSNVSYIGEEELEMIQPLTFQDAVKELEGVTFFDGVGNGWDSSFGMRGFSGSSRIVFVVDGVRINEVDGAAVTFPLINMNDMSSIQVERGSASPVYGSDAFAGVVNLTTRSFSDKKLKLFGGLEGSSFTGLNFYQGFSGTLEDKITGIGGKFKYYFNGGRDVGAGYRENGEWRITSFDTKVEYELPDEQGRIYAGVKHIEDDISNPGELTYNQYQEAKDRTNKPLDGREFKNTIVQVGADHKFFDDHVTASILGSWRPNKIRFYTTSGTFTDGPFNPDTDVVTVKSKDNNLTTQVKYEDQFTEWLGNETQIGMEFRDQDNYSLEQDVFLDGNVAESSPRETERFANPDNIGLFWRETLNFFDKVIPYFGMRHDFNWLNTEDYLTPRNNISKRWDKSTLSTGVTVKPVKFMDVFANYSQGFRVPTISEIAPFNGALSVDLQPEETDSYEVGTRLRYNDLAAYKMSYFVIDAKNEIAFNSNAIGALSPFGQNINIGKSRRYGVEQRIDFDPIKELNLYGSYTWLNAYVRETNVNGSPFDGRTLGQIPENRFTWGGMVSPFERLGAPYSGLKTGLRGVYTGPQHPQSYESSSEATLNSSGAARAIKGYTVWDYILSYEWREIQAYFKINNVFDEKYYSRSVTATSFGTAIYPSGTYSFVNPGAPREFVFGTKWEI